MNHFGLEELTEAIRSITSTISKSEKALAKLKEGTAQHSMTARGIKAYYIAIDLISRESEAKDKDTMDSLQGKYVKEELEDALLAIASANSRCEGVLPKLTPGSSQHTLTVRRIKAFSITTALINRELTKA
jgi:hypothetical protein